MTSTMQWEVCPTHVGTQGEDNALQLFGHTCSIVDARSTWGTELCICFGGVRQTLDGPGAEQHQALQEVSAMTADGESWFRPRVESAKPPARAFHCAAVVGQHIYVFGGHVLNEDDNRRKRTFFNDMWQLNSENWRWQPVNITMGEVPCKRDMATLTPLGDDVLLLFGGRNEAGRTLGDAWLYDIEKCQWHQLRAGGVHPAPRKMHAAAYVNGRVLVFGGERDNGVLDDLWSLKLPTAPLSAWLPQHLAQQAAHAGTPLLVHGTGQGDELCRWTQIRVRPSPPARFGHSLTVCGGGRLLLLFGGCLDQAGFLALTHSFVQCDETWVLDMASFSWQREYPMLLGPGLPDTPNTPTTPPSVTLTSQGGGGASPGSSAPPGLPDGPKGPHERMCHSMGALADGRLLLLGGRRKEGICKDGWWLHLEPRPLPTPPTSHPPSAVGSTTPQDGTAKPLPAIPSAPAILKSLFNPAAAAAARQQHSPPVHPTSPSAPALQQPSTLGSASKDSSTANVQPPTTHNQQSVSSTTASTAAATAAATASAAVSKLTGRLLGTARNNAATPPTATSGADVQDVAGPGQSGSSVSASGSNSWLQAVPDRPLAGQLLDKLGALKAALPWQQQQPMQPAQGQQQGWQPYQPQPPPQQQQGWSTGMPVGYVADQGIDGTSNLMSQQSGFPSLDVAAVMAIQAAADAAEFEQFRENVLRLPPIPNPTSLPARFPAPTLPNTTVGTPSPPSSLLGPAAPDPAHARAVRQILHQRGQLLSAQHPAGFPQDPIFLARRHLSQLQPDEISLTDLTLVMQDYPIVLHAVRHNDMAGQGLPTGLPADHMSVLARLHGLKGLACSHLLMSGVDPLSTLRIGDVPALMDDYCHLCNSTA